MNLSGRIDFQIRESFRTVTGCKDELSCMTVIGAVGGDLSLATPESRYIRDMKVFDGIDSSEGLAK